ncbi:hypothetical protein MAESPC_01708 [Microcystis aeruginosa SPC777]|uniref:Uncharacterized protein n=1 Tax=Microcystis aeruginosa SPC777 TaxID=482300 RepID=S3J9U1_MICAE|nr:hypothetical protein MAESPC_01708 [Microcystis aeruginosa SPC777]
MDENRTQAYLNIIESASKKNQSSSHNHINHSTDNG